LLSEAAETKAQQLAKVRREVEKLTEETVNSFRLIGDTYYNRYAFEQALALYKQALGYVWKEAFPRHWAMLATQIGRAYRELGIRVEAAALHQHFCAAVESYRQALEVQTREHLPQDWARSQAGLGAVLGEQGARTEGEAGQRLLAAAVAAYRQALEVQTREHLPQDWARSQAGLGAVLGEQGARTEGEAGQRLLAAAVAAYRQALEVQTREHLPQDWAQTQYCLAQAYLGLKSWLNAATSFAQLLQVYPDDEEAYYAAHVLYHEKLFAFEEAFALSRQWLRRHSADVEAQSQFAEQCLTTGRFAEAAEYFASLLADSTLEPRLKVPLQALEIVARLALHPNEPISEQLQCLRVTITGQAKNFSLGWTFGGVKHFVGQEARLTPYRAWLLKLFTALEKKDREAMLNCLADLEEAIVILV
jgi:tetratricopeptide (TPR) repeat protein